MTAVGNSKLKQAIWAECEAQGLAYCKAKAELSFGARRLALLEWVTVAETQVKAREQEISLALEMQQSAQAAKKSARRNVGLGIGLAALVIIIVLMNVDLRDLLN